MLPTALRFPSRAYHLLNRFRNGMTLGVRAAVFDDRGHIFLVRHSYVRGWYMPGGGVDKGESMQAALRRELLEEGGIGLTGPATLFGFYWNNQASPRDHVAFYVCRDWKQLHPPPRSFEIVESGFYPTDALPPETTDATRRRLAELATGSEPAAEW